MVSVSEEVRSRCHLKHRVPQTISESTSSDSISGDLAAHTPHIPHPPVSPQATSAVSPGGTFTSPAPFPSGGGCGGMSPKATPDLPVFAPAGKCVYQFTLKGQTISIIKCKIILLFCFTLQVLWQAFQLWEQVDALQGS